MCRMGIGSAEVRNTEITIEQGEARDGHHEDEAGRCQDPRCVARVDDGVLLCADDGFERRQTVGLGLVRIL